MNYRTLGSSDLKISEFSFGCMTFGNDQWRVGGLDEKQSAELVSLAIERGVNFFDTADIYAYGDSERILGKVLKGRREKVLIATKVGSRMSPRPDDAGLSRGHIADSCEASLRRLGTDRIDLYQIHCWDSRTPLEETLQALDELVKRGKVRYLGASNLAAWQLAKALRLQRENRWAPFVSLQPYYSLAGRDIENELVPLCEEEKIGILPWAPLAGGYLSGKYRHGQRGRRTDSIGEFPPVDKGRGEKILDKLEEIGRARGLEPAQVALAWLKSRPQISSVIVGAKNSRQLESNLAASAVLLTAEEAGVLDKISAPELPYPQWMLAFQSREREP